MTPLPRPGFDPGAPARAASGLFGLDTSAADAGVHVLGVPFEATTSYRRGTAHGPAAILRASHQIDLFDLMTGKPYAAGIWMAPLDEQLVAWNAEASERATRVIERAGEVAGDAGLEADLARVNAIGGQVNRWVHDAVASSLNEGKLACVVGGDHATALGSIEAHAERFPGLGLLHVDAHADLRVAYEGFTFSHASVMHNVVERVGRVSKVVQVGIRDLSEEEYDAIAASGGRIETLFDPEWAEARARGANLQALVRRTLQPLPRDVYVTFDVDGLDPQLCPHTGTPVPGGLSWSEAMLLLSELVRSGRRIVGFDLNEVAPARRADGAPADADESDGIDEIVGARLLYRLIGFALLSRRAAGG